MNQGTYPLAASMVNQINRLDQISNNLANSNTNGFKQDGLTETTFNQYLQRVQNEGLVANEISTITNNIPKIDAKYIDNSVGAIATTGNKLDFALEQADTFFKVQNNNGDIVYTRDGAFKVLDGFLVDSNGSNVLDADNGPIEVDANVRALIGITQIPFSNLEKIGNNSFKLKDENELAVFDNNDGLIIEGAIEKSNVNSVTAMVELIDAHRRFDQSQKAIKTIDEMNKKLIDEVGSTSS